MTRSVDWTTLAIYPTGLEADLASATLTAAGIPHQLVGERDGLFGATFQGSVPGGLAIVVPETEVVRARELVTAS